MKRRVFLGIALAGLLAWLFHGKTEPKEPKESPCRK